MSDAATSAAAPAAPAPAPAAAAPAADATTLITAPAAAPAAATFDAATGKPVDGAPAADGAKVDDDAGGKTPEQIEADRVAAEKADKPTGAPEKYADFTPPEGGALDSAVMEQFAQAARDLDLPQDKAQQLIDKMAPTIAARQAERIEAVNAEWIAAAQSDKEYGGDKLAENLVHAKRAYDAFATPELKALMEQTKIGNNPEMIRFMVRAGKAIAEDKVVVGGTMGSANRSTADVLYGGTAKK